MLKQFFLSILAVVVALVIGVTPTMLVSYVLTHSGDISLQFYNSAFGQIVIFLTFIVSAILGTSCLLRAFNRINKIGIEEVSTAIPAAVYTQQADKIAKIIDIYHTGAITASEAIRLVKDEVKVFPDIEGGIEFSIKA